MSFERVIALALVLPVRQTVAPREFWGQILEALESLDVRTEVIAGGVKPLERGQPPRRHRLFVPSTSFVPSLLRSSAHIFLCVEYGAPTLVAGLTARFTGRRTIILQEHRGREGVPLSYWQRRYRRFVVLFVDAFVANTDAAYAELHEVLGIRQSKIYRATVVVPPERDVLSKHPSAMRAPARRPLFLFVGQLIPRKNVGSLLEAATSLRARGYEFELWVVGEGQERAELERRALALAAEGFVKFVGSIANTEIGEVYKTADVFVMPSVRDYRSVAVLEAMRFGKPVIDSVHDGNAGDFVRHELTGLIFDPHEPGALAAAMERALLEPEMFREMGTRAVALLDEHTPHTAAAELRRILDVLGGP